MRHESSQLIHICIRVCLKLERAYMCSLKTNRDRKGMEIWFESCDILEEFYPLTDRLNSNQNQYS